MSSSPCTRRSSKRLRRTSSRAYWPVENGYGVAADGRRPKWKERSWSPALLPSRLPSPDSVSPQCGEVIPVSFRKSFAVCARQLHHTTVLGWNLLHDGIARYFGIRRSEVPRSRSSSHSTQYFGIPLVRPSTAKRIQFLSSPVIRSGFVACKFGNAAEKPLNGSATPTDPVTIERRRLGSIYRITSSFTGPCTIAVDSVGIVLATVGLLNPPVGRLHPRRVRDDVHPELRAPAPSRTHAPLAGAHQTFRHRRREGSLDSSTWDRRLTRLASASVSQLHPSGR